MSCMMLSPPTSPPLRTVWRICSINPKCASFPPPTNCATLWALADTRTIFCMTTAESTRSVPAQRSRV